MAQNDIPWRLGGIPSQYEDGFAKLRRLNDEQARELSAVLGEVPPTMDYSAMTSALTRKISTIPQNDMADIVFALLPLSTLQADLDTSASNVAESISQMMEGSNSEKLRLPSEERERFEKFLVELLNSSSLEVAGKARSLQLEDEHVFQDARIVTDIRPVFGATPKDPPGGAVIVHTLKLSYLDDSQFKDFFLAMDARDIRILRDLLERADSKAESLRTILENAGVPHVGVREG